MRTRPWCRDWISAVAVASALAACGASAEPSSFSEGVTAAAPLELQAVVVVRTGRPNLAVRAQGRVLATTDRDGVAHTVIAMAPRSSVRVVVDTTGRGDLDPANPSHTLTLADRDEIFVIDQPFDNAGTAVTRIE